MRPLITIIIPSYKRFHKIKKALSSIQTQSFQDWELIVVDNNSKDGTKELVSSLNDDRIKFFEINNNGFISKSRNLGIEKSNGKYLAFLDSDDWWTTNKLQIVEKYINKGYKFLYHDMYISKKNNLIKTKTKYCRELFKPIYSDLIENGPAFPTSSVVVEKKLFNLTKNFDETKDLITWEDYDAWIKFSKINEEFIKLPGVLGYIKIDNENLLSSDKSIKNIYYFKSRYIQKKTLPIWCLFSLVRSYILKKDFRNAKTNLDILKKNKLNFKNKIRYIFFQVLCYMNVSN